MTTTQIPAWTLGDRLRKSRQITGLTQTQFGHQMGISKDSVMRYEAGETTPGAGLVYGWAVICEVDPSWLLTGIAGPSDTDSVTGRYQLTFDDILSAA